MRVSGIAVYASMLTALIGIEAPHAAQIRALDFIDKSLRKYLEKFSLGVMHQCLLALLLCGEIVEVGLYCILYESVVRVGLCAPAPDIEVIVIISHWYILMRKCSLQHQYTNKFSKSYYF